MCEFNTKSTIAQLLRLTIVSAKSKICSPRRGCLSPPYNSSASRFFADVGAHFVETQARLQQTDLFSFVTYAHATYSVLPQKSSRITFQPTYANLLSSKITQHDKFTKAGNLKKNFSSEKCIETNNVFAIRGKNPSYFLACVKTRHPIVSIP